MQAQELLDQRPMLRIDPGMHTATMLRIGVDAACSLMVTGSDDKTARLWALPEGGRGAPELLRTLRVPIGEGNDGKVYAVALSPNGKWVAAGGWDVGYVGVGRGTNSVYIFDGVQDGLSSASAASAVSSSILLFRPMAAALPPRSAAAKACGCGRRGSWRLLAEDKDYGGKDSYGAAFDGANQLFTVAFDGQIRRYGADGHLEAKAATQGGKEPYSIAMHPKMQSSPSALTIVRQLRFTMRARLRVFTRPIPAASAKAASMASPGPPMGRGFTRADAVTRSLEEPCSDLARRRPRPALGSASVAEHNQAVLALRRGHRMGRARSCLRPDCREWREAGLAGGRHRRHAG